MLNLCVVRVHNSSYSSVREDTSTTPSQSRQSLVVVTTMAMKNVVAGGKEFGGDHETID